MRALAVAAVLLLVCVALFAPGFFSPAKSRPARRIVLLLLRASHDRFSGGRLLAA